MQRQAGKRSHRLDLSESWRDPEQGSKDPEDSNLEPSSWCTAGPSVLSSFCAFNPTARSHFLHSLSSCQKVTLLCCPIQGAVYIYLGSQDTGLSLLPNITISCQVGLTLSWRVGMEGRQETQTCCSLIGCRGVKHGFLGFPSKYTYCNLGWTLSAVDMNGDGEPDLVMGSPFAPGGGKQRGFVAAFYSSSSRSHQGSAGQAP